MSGHEAPDFPIEVTQADIDEAKRLGLSGSEMVARAIRRQYPDARSVHVDIEAGTIEVETGEPLD